MNKLNFFTIAPEPGGMRVLLYGRSGVGKTTVAANILSHNDFVPALLVDVDRGLRSIQYMQHGGALRGVSLSSVLELRVILEQLLMPDASRLEELRGVKTIIIDSLSAFRDDTMAEIRANEAKKGRRVSEYITQIQDYNQALAIIDTTIAQLRNTGINLIMTAEEKITYDATGIVADAQPNLNPQLSRAIHHKMDYIWPMEKYDGRVGVRVLTPAGVPCAHLVKSRGPLFERALASDEHVNAKGFFMVPDHTFQVLPYLYDLYTQSLEK